ncbi:cytochrome P450 2B5-like [Pomacea canaliculata]|uniref:cytochrome P450 2B5-like n=1 Tax=Pomacea canaliculata TaxID=400727 RepID=UPI000D735001|nr:cytochrome P450 2B5-like [Pomacea canaliculata]
MTTAMAQDEATTFLLGVMVTLVLLLWRWSTRRPSSLPPGSGTALPLIGHQHLLSRNPRVQFAAWRRQYGDVFSLYVGNRLIVVLSGYRVIKDALMTHGDVFSDRPHMFLTDVIAKNRGVVGTSGAHWKEQRKVSLEILREMGLGRNLLAEKIQEEVREYVKAVAALQGAAFDPKTLTYTSVSNNICSIVFGERFEYNVWNASLTLFNRFLTSSSLPPSLLPMLPRPVIALRA